MGDLANRLQTDSLPQLKKSMKEEKNEKIRKQKSKLIQDMKSFLELYQTYNITEYDFWNYVHCSMFSLFVEKFEHQGQQLEIRCSQAILGMIVNGPEDGE